MLGESDRSQVGFARNRDWLLFAFDDDFLTLVEAEGIDHAGVIYADQRGMRVGDVVRSLDAVLTTLPADWRSVHYL